MTLDDIYAAAAADTAGSSAGPAPAPQPPRRRMTMDDVYAEMAAPTPAQPTKRRTTLDDVYAEAQAARPKRTTLDDVYANIGAGSESAAPPADPSLAWVQAAEAEAKSTPNLTPEARAAIYHRHADAAHGTAAEQVAKNSPFIPERYVPEPGEAAAIVGMVGGIPGAVASYLKPELFSERPGTERPQPLNAAFRDASGKVLNTLAAAATPEQASALQQTADALPAVLPADNTTLNNIAGGAGAQALSLSILIAGGPKAAALFGAVEGTGAGRIEAARRRERGEDVSGLQETGLAAGNAVTNAATEYAGGRLTTKVLPGVVDKLGGGPVKRAVTSVVGNLLSGSAEEAVAQVGQNAVTRQIVDENRPGYFQGVREAAEGGLGGGLVSSPVTYQATRQQAQQEQRQEQRRQQAPPPPPANRPASSPPAPVPPPPTPPPSRQAIAGPPRQPEAVDAPEASPREQVAPESPQTQTRPIPAGPVAEFTTEQGSTYAVAGNTTTRTKSKHAGHDPNDVGVKTPIRADRLRLAGVRPRSRDVEHLVGVGEADRPARREGRSRQSQPGHGAAGPGRDPGQQHVFHRAAGRSVAAGTVGQGARRQPLVRQPPRQPDRRRSHRRESGRARLARAGARGIARPAPHPGSRARIDAGGPAATGGPRL